MNIKLCGRTLTPVFILFILTQNMNIFGQDSLSYADYLMKSHDFFRAISEYKKIHYYATDDEIKNNCLLNISKAYMKSNKYKLSIRYASLLLNKKNIEQEYVIKANNYIGLNYYGLRVLNMAEDYFNKTRSIDNTGFSLFYLSLVDIEKGQYETARQKYISICEAYPESELYDISKRLSDRVLLARNIQKRSPLISTVLSTLIPGSGQIYCQHYYDGIQAFMYVGAFAFASWISYKYDKKYNNHYLTTYASLSVTAIFHLGNIIGASKTASYYNLKQKEKYLDAVRKDVFSIDY
ncbi:hypothetical protein JW835_15210 [bacterium]|nr:hypothetical protein [bacterium]